MMGSLFIGATGMKTHSTGLGTVSNNIANANTIGYKQQQVVFQDLFSQDLAIGATGSQGPNQAGMGAQVGSVRTIFTQGAFEPGNSVTDLAIGGKGFFQVTSEDKVHYTRAGNFRFTQDGFLNDPSGFTLMGSRISNNPNIKKETLEPIQLDFNDPTVAKSPAKTSTALNAVVNLGDSTDKTQSEANPYFALLESWKGNGTPPISTSNYSYAQPMRVYDQQGNSHDITVYFDGAPSSTGSKTFEYLVAMNPSEDGSAASGTDSAGLLMSGTMTFSSNGELKNMTAFTPTGSATKDLNAWQPAPLVNGLPQFSANFVGAGIQPLTLDFGIKSQQNMWAGAPASAAAIGTDIGKLPSMMPIQTSSGNSTARNGSSSTRRYSQDGYPQGDLVDITITSEGKLQGKYSNSQVVDFYNIPLARFTSEDGLRREGNNHYSATLDSGGPEFGLPGTSNYGKLSVNQLETSNVDMSREMVNMIIIQRGFQMNSKSVTTADTMLQKALELKR